MLPSHTPEINLFKDWEQNSHTFKIIPFQWKFSNTFLAARKGYPTILTNLKITFPMNFSNSRCINILAINTVINLELFQLGWWWPGWKILSEKLLCKLHHWVAGLANKGMNFRLSFKKVEERKHSQTQKSCTLFCHFLAALAALYLPLVVSGSLTDWLTDCH